MTKEGLFVLITLVIVALGGFLVAGLGGACLAIGAATFYLAVQFVLFGK